MASRESEALADLYRSWAGRMAADPEMPIDQFRDMFEEWATVTAEPVGVTFEETTIGGLPALWARPSSYRQDRLLLCFHGGGYVTGSRASHRKMFGHIAKAAGVPALIVEYRLAPENPFPAAIEDALAAYRWALSSGVAARNIAFVGDSAGGGLAIASTLAARRDALPVPGAIFVMSPWLDLAATGASYDANAEVDLIVSRAIIHNLTPALLGPDGSIDDPIANPIRADPAGLPPLLIQVGSDESFLDDSRHFAARAKQGGVDVELDVVPEMQHVFQFLGGVAPEADAAIQRAGAWLDAKLTA
ncbi:alpha/beta hydrolase [Sphingomonas sp.]|uniref:alpha/beta hydrolase n=1 Tax=Sphingomonas sp. TaxID=28214 RepID=UPI00286D5E5A|nr:alpha/beta hydrolase [Sphingomonas sp.]